MTIQELIKHEGGVPAFCRATGVPYRTAYKWKRGERRVSDYEVAAFADALRWRERRRPNKKHEPKPKQETKTVRIEIHNVGALVLATDFFDSLLAKRGIVYVSVNAGTVRVLLPPALESAISETSRAYEAIISRGWWDAIDGEGLEIMFEDGGESPYVLHTGLEQWDLTLGEGDAEKSLKCALWTADGAQRTMPARFRVVDAIPCLDPWEED